MTSFPFLILPCSPFSFFLPLPSLSPAFPPPSPHPSYPPPSPSPPCLPQPTSVDGILQEHIVVSVRRPRAHPLSVGAADLGDEVHELAAAGIHRLGEELAGVGALEGGRGRHLQPAAALGDEAALHLLEVTLEGLGVELVPDEGLAGRGSAEGQRGMR